ncbi:MAG TPA: sulfurtransferase [Oligoflexia bacterium]|nr:sulfurtransferase [Oligoflexia bacterium]HMP49004.1 sulfurtransferase [Oligoflexia bacterium]
MAVKEIELRGYVTPEVLVSTEWVADNLGNSGIRLVESNEDQLLYPSGHIHGAIEIDWVRDLNDPLRRDYLDKSSFQELLSRSGISKDTTVIFYGDKNNWWATYAFWIFQLFGHSNARVMDGGRLKWSKEGRSFTRDIPSYPPTDYVAPVRDDKRYRALRDDVMCHVSSGLPLIDVRSPEEYSGERMHMEGYPNEGALRGGHIPGAKNVPWAKAVEPDTGTFRDADELFDIYTSQAGITPDKDIIAYCRIGERSSHTWFVLTYLLGFPNVRNYDGSWTEWGNMVNVPIEK